MTLRDEAIAAMDMATGASRVIVDGVTTAYPPNDAALDGLLAWLRDNAAVEHDDGWLTHFEAIAREPSVVELCDLLSKEEGTQ